MIPFSDRNENIDDVSVQDLPPSESACIVFTRTFPEKEEVMPRGKQSKGQCTYCKTEIAKNSITKHLSTCEKRQAIMCEAEHSKRDQETLYHLRIQDAWRPDFWLDVEIVILLSDIWYHVVVDLEDCCE